MLCLACNAGIRVTELVGLGLDDVRMPQFDEVRAMGMGRRARVLPPWKETGSALGTWLSIRPGVPDRHPFLNVMERGMTRRGRLKPQPVLMPRQPHRPQDRQRHRGRRQMPDLLRTINQLIDTTALLSLRASLRNRTINFPVYSNAAKDDWE